MPRSKLMKFIRTPMKGVYQCNSQEDTKENHQRHAAINVTFTNWFRRQSSQNFYRNPRSINRKNSTSSTKSNYSDRSGSSIVSSELGPNAARHTLSPSQTRQLEMAKTLGPLLDELSEDGLPMLPLDNFDGCRLMVPEASVKILVLYCLEDEMIAQLFLQYLRRAFPFAEVLAQCEGVYGCNVFDYWQDIVDTVSFVFILMSQEFLSFARQESMMVIVCQEMEMKDTYIVPVYLEKITPKESTFLMDFENRYDISVQRNGFRHLHCWLKMTLTRHALNGCPQSG